MHKLIFLAEDDPDDAFLFREALRKVSPDCAVEIVGDGREMLEKLQTPHQAPGVIILDINMPGMGGMECLDALKKIPGLKDTPVVMFSTGADARTIERAYASGANFFAAKPHTFEQLVEIVDIIVHRKWPQRQTGRSGANSNNS